MCTKISLRSTRSYNIPRGLETKQEKNWKEKKGGQQAQQQQQTEFIKAEWTRVRVLV